MTRINSIVFWVSLSVSLAAAALSSSAAAAHTAYVTGLIGEESIATRTTSAAPGDVGSYVVPINLDTKTVGTEIPLGGDTAPWSVAITPDGTKAYVVDTGANRVIPIDTATNTAGTPIEVGNFPTAIAITPDGTRAYVGNLFSKSVTPIDLVSGTAGPEITVGKKPNDIAITPDGTRAYVANAEAETVSRIDIATDKVVNTIPVGEWPAGLAITPDGTRLYVADLDGGTVERIDLATDTVGETIVTAPNSEELEITPDGMKAFVLGFSSPVTELDLTSDTNVASIPFGGNTLYSLGILADGSRAYITNSTKEKLEELDVATGSPAGSIPIGESPEAVAIVPNQGPEASFSVTPTEAEPKETIEFDASASSDSDGSVARYDWDFGDGETEEDGVANPTHSYEADGYYDVTLTVTDDEGCSTTFVFTGQTAYCNGSTAAQATEMVDIDTAPPEKPKEEPKKEEKEPEAPKGPAAPVVESGNPTVQLQRTPTPAGEVKVKAKHKTHCPTVTARAMTFKPKLVSSHVVPGVRVRMAANRPTQLTVRATLIWSEDGVRHEASLGGRSARINDWIRLRFALPEGLRETLPYHRKVKVKLEIQTLPSTLRGAKPSLCRELAHRMVEVRITKVIPNAVQRG